MDAPVGEPMFVLRPLVPEPGRAPVLWTKRRARAELPRPPARSASGDQNQISDEKACSWLDCREGAGRVRLPERQE